MTRHLGNDFARIRFPFWLPPLLLWVFLVSSPAFSQSLAAPGKSAAMQSMSRDFEDLVRRVSPAVVEVLVTGYGVPEEDKNSSSSKGLGRQRSLGAGVIVDPDGWIVTNYHVVKGADRVRVVLTPQVTRDSQPYALLKAHGRALPARILGYNKQIDLAVLKIDATGLPTLPIAPYVQLEKGQIVLAFGSPEGLENSVSFGLVSSVLRQPDPDNPMVYIQTDAAINPGNSGGPLVDLDGNMVGINTFIYTQSGGNEGIGFAIPGGIVRYAYEQIRKYGRVHRMTIGADVQSVTPDLAQGLGLSTDSGVIVSDLLPESPAEHAGLRIGDVLVAMDRIPVDNVPLFVLTLYMRDSASPVKLQVVRGEKKLELNVPVSELQDQPDQLSELADPAKDLIPGLGIVGLTITPEIIELLGYLRNPSGVIVTSLVANELAVDSGLLEGDVIHSLNGKPVASVDGLREAFNHLKPGEAGAMQIERNGKLTYVTFQME
jgi:serine protease Do